MSHTQDAAAGVQACTHGCRGALGMGVDVIAADNRSRHARASVLLLHTSCGTTLGVSAMAVPLGAVLPTGTSMVAVVEVLLPSADVVVWFTVIVMLLDAIVRTAAVRTSAGRQCGKGSNDGACKITYFFCFIKIMSG